MPSTNSNSSIMAINEVDDQEFVPPPPPHIELLRIGCKAHEGQCISRVISYLDGKSRRAACLSCTYLRDAVAKQATRERTISLQEPITLVAVESPCRVTDIDALPVAFESNNFKKHRHNDDDDSYAVSNADPADEAPAGEGNDWSWLTEQEQEDPVEGKASDHVDTERKEPQVEEQTADAVDLAAEAPLNGGLESKLKKLGGEDSQVAKHVGEDVSELTASTFSNELPAMVAKDACPEKEEEEESPATGSEGQDLAQVEQAEAKTSQDYPADKKQTILAELDDLEEELSKHSSIASIPDEVQADQASIEPSVSHEITVNEAELESLCTVEREAQTETFLSEVNSSGARTPVSLLPSQSYDDWQEENDHSRGLESDGDQGSFLDELSALPTVSSYRSESPSTASRLTPIIDTPSPASLTGATRLELGSTCHLGESHQLQISGCDDQQRSSAGTSKRGSITSSGNSEDMQQISLGSNKEVDEKVQQPPNMPQQLPSFTRLNDIRNVATEEIPFDELFKPVARRARVLSESMSSISSSDHRVLAGSRSESPGEPPELRRTTTDDVMSAVPYSNMSCHTEDDMTAYTDYTDYTGYSDDSTTPDVLAQLSDAALFGDGQKAVTEFMSEIVDSAKGAVSLFYLNGRRNDIDDHGPIKIGDKYYSHNEALQLWRKAKVKLEDRYHQVDENGDVKMERATFFEKNSVFQEKPKKKTSNTKASTGTEGKDEEMSLDKMVKKYRILGKRDNMRKNSRFDEFTDESVGFGESTAVAGHIVSNDEDSSGPLSLEDSKLSPTSSPSRVSFTNPEDEKKTTQEKRVTFSIEVDSATDDTESETMESNISEVVSVSASDTSESDASPARSRSATLGESNDSLDKNNCKVNDLNDSIMLTRDRAFVGENEGNDKMPLLPESVEPASADKKLNIETDSVAGKDSLPSHMGSNYGLEVTSLRGMSCNFINGKSSEQVKLMSGRSVRKDGAEQSVLGSQYGTEVMFKPKSKVATARKPRTLASHNMGVKKVATSAKQGTAMKQGNNNNNTRSTPSSAGVTRRGSQRHGVSNKGPSPSLKNSMSKSNQPASTKLQKAKSMKTSLPLKLKLGRKKSVKP